MQSLDERKAILELQIKGATDFLCARSASWTPITTKLMVRSVIYALAQCGWELKAKDEESE